MKEKTDQEVNSKQPRTWRYYLVGLISFACLFCLFTVVYSFNSVVLYFIIGPHILTLDRLDSDPFAIIGFEIVVLFIIILVSIPLNLYLARHTTKRLLGKWYDKIPFVEKKANYVLIFLVFMLSWFVINMVWAVFKSKVIISSRLLEMLDTEKQLWSVIYISWEMVKSLLSPLLNGLSGCAPLILKTYHYATHMSVGESLIILALSLCISIIITITLQKRNYK